MGRPPIGKKAMAGAERLRRYRAKRDERLKAEAAAIKAEIDRLKAENVELRRRIIAKAKPKVIHTPPRSESELERQLKAARTRIKNLTAEARHAWQKAKTNPSTISKAQLRKLEKALHPDGGATANAAARRS